MAPYRNIVCSLLFLQLVIFPRNLEQHDRKSLLIKLLLPVGSATSHILTAERTEKSTVATTDRTTTYFVFVSTFALLVADFLCVLANT